MSNFSNQGNIQLGDLIEYLSSLPQDLVIANGFGEPDSYRGYYEDLAFAPKLNMTVSEMLSAARSALGKTFTGYKGGDFAMTTYTDCWLAPYGECGIPIVRPDSIPKHYVLPTAQGVKL